MNMRNSKSRDDLSSRTTLLSELVATIREDLLSKCQPGDMMPSERSLANVFHASRSRIHKVMDQLCQGGWLKRVPGQGYMVKRFPQRPPALTGLFFPGVPFPLIVNPFYQEVYLGICETAAAHKRHILSFFGAKWRPEDLGSDEFWSPSMRRAIDSLLTLEVFDENLIRRAAEFYPVVCLDMPCQLPGISSIYFDHAASIQMAFKYLLDLGHRRIGYVGRPPSDDPADAERLAAFRRALRWTGEPAVSDGIFQAAHEPVNSIVAQWLAMALDRRPTALIVPAFFWDLVVRFYSAGVQIPQDVSLVQVGSLTTWPHYARTNILCPDQKMTLKRLPVLQAPFDNLPTELAALTPTSVSLPSREMGRLGVLEIIRRKADPAAEPKCQMLTPKLVQGVTAQPLQ